MAKLFLDANDTFTVSDDVEIIGAAGGNEVVKISGSPNVQLDANIERIELSGNVADYTYLVAGTTITVLLNGTAVATLNGLNQTAKVAFADGSADLELTGLGAAALGGTALPTGTAAAVAPGTIDANDPSTVGDNGSVAGQTFTLTADTDISGSLVGSAGTTSNDGNDTFEATQDTYQATDVILGGAGTDTLNVATNAAITAEPTMAGVEDINFNFTTLTDADVALGGVSTGNVTINQAQVGSTGVSGVTNAGSITVNFGDGLTGTNTVAQKAGATTVINAGNSTGVTVTGGTTGSATVNGGATTTTAAVTMTTGSATVSGDALTSVTSTAAASTLATKADAATFTVTGTGTTDTADITIGKAATIANQAGNAVETLTISGDNTTEANVASVTTTAASNYVLAGDNEIVLNVAGALVDGATVTSTATGSALTKVTFDNAADDNDLTKVATNIELIGTAHAGESTSVADGANVKLSADATADVAIVGVAATAATNVLNLEVASTQAGGVTVTNTKTVNLNVSATSDLSNVAAGTADIIASGAGNLAVDSTSVANKLDASAMTGTLNATAGAATIAEITGGSGNDDIGVTTAETVTVDGGAGTADTIHFAANNTLATFSNFEVGQMVDATNSFKASQLTGSNLVVKGFNGTDDVVDIGTVAGSFDSATIDLSGMLFDANVTSVDITADDAADLGAAIAAGATINITGSVIDDNIDITHMSANNTVSTGNGDDTITTAGGNDTITAGEGADTITAGLGTDSIDLTETTAAIDTVILTTGGAVAKTTITGFDVATAANKGDNVDIDLSDLNGLLGGALRLAGDGTGAAAVDPAPTVTTVAAGAYDMGTVATSDILAFAGDYASAGDLETALEVGGTSVLTGNGAFSAGDAFLALYDNGTNSYLAYVTTTAGIADDANFTGGDLTVTNIVEFVGVADATTFVSDNFDIVT